jgi:uncharacterized protein
MRATTHISPPTSARERIFALDVLRGVAVLGILLMNITGMGLPYAAVSPAYSGGSTGVDLWTWIITSTLFEGTLRGLFTLLFGAGVVLYTSRLERAGMHEVAADLYFRRTIWLIVFGLVNAYLLVWAGDILFCYGVVGLFLYVFRHLPVRRLLWIAVPLLCVQTVTGTLQYVDFQSQRAKAEYAQGLQAQGVKIDAGQTADIENFTGLLDDWQHDPQQVADKTVAIRGSYASAFRENAAESFYFQTEFLFLLMFWECMGMMLLGMALFKSGALTGDWSTSRYLRMLLIGWSIGLAVNWFEAVTQVRSSFSVDSVLSAQLVTYDLGRIPLTLGHLAFIMLLLKGGVFRRAFALLANAGQMALTNYLTQSVIGMLVFTGAGLALYGQLQRHQLYYVVLAVWVVQLVWSAWWLQRYRYGPMEWLWRSLTRGERQPMRRTASADGASDG